MATAREIEAEGSRPMAYFSHDSDAALDIKCRRLIRREGMAGYGRWWRLCELMAAEEGHRIDVGSAEDAEIYAEELMLDGVEELTDFLRTLCDVGLVQMPGDGTVSSERMLKNAEVFGEKRANGRLGGRPRKSPVKTNHF